LPGKLTDTVMKVNENKALSTLATIFVAEFDVDNFAYIGPCSVPAISIWKKCS